MNVASRQIVPQELTAQSFAIVDTDSVPPHGMRAILARPNAVQIFVTISDAATLAAVLRVVSEL